MQLGINQFYFQQVKNHKEPCPARSRKSVWCEISISKGTNKDTAKSNSGTSQSVVVGGRRVCILLQKLYNDEHWPASQKVSLSRILWHKN